ncbi:unnamed protein product, partial [marine sediment metagenome]
MADSDELNLSHSEGDISRSDSFEDIQSNDENCKTKQAENCAENCIEEICEDNSNCTGKNSSKRFLPTTCSESNTTSNNGSPYDSLIQMMIPLVTSLLNNKSGNGGLADLFGSLGKKKEKCPVNSLI